MHLSNSCNRNCSIDGFVYDSTIIEGLKVELTGNTLNNCELGIQAIGYTPVIVDMSGGNELNCNTDTEEIGDYVQWYWRLCRTCPTYFRTPNYPSNYNNCDYVSATLNAPGSDGYYIKVYGNVEWWYDRLYIMEMDGTIISCVSGCRKYCPYYKWINSNRSVKVLFISDYSITCEGYDVTVID